MIEGLIAYAATGWWPLFLVAVAAAVALMLAIVVAKVLFLIVGLVMITSLGALVVGFDEIKRRVFNGKK